MNVCVSGFGGGSVRKIEARFEKLGTMKKTKRNEKRITVYQAVPRPPVPKKRFWVWSFWEGKKRSVGEEGEFDLSVSIDGGGGGTV